MRTEDWGIPQLVEGQAQSSVTHNDAVRMMQILCAASVVAQQDAPPVSFVDGDVYIVGTGSGAWAGKDNKLAGAYADAWIFVPDVDGDSVDIPIGTRHAGLRKWVQYVGGFLLWDGTAWVAD